MNVIANKPSNFMNHITRNLSLITLCWLFISATACTPTVKVEVPDKPIVINLNVKIQHEIRIKVDQELDAMFSDDEGLF